VISGLLPPALFPSGHLFFTQVCTPAGALCEVRVAYDSDTFQLSGKGFNQGSLNPCRILHAQGVHPPSRYTSVRVAAKGLWASLNACAIKGHPNLIDSFRIIPLEPPFNAHCFKHCLPKFYRLQGIQDWERT